MTSEWPHSIHSKSEWLHSVPEKQTCQTEELTDEAAVSAAKEGACQWDARRISYAGCVD